MSSLPAGWYKDPADPTTQRWWDGEGWLGKPIPADQEPPEGPPPADEPPTPAETAPVTPATGDSTGQNGQTGAPWGENGASGQPWGPGAAGQPGQDWGPTGDSGQSGQAGQPGGPDQGGQVGYPGYAAPGQPGQPGHPAQPGAPGWGPQSPGAAPWGAPGGYPPGTPPQWTMPPQGWHPGMQVPPGAPVPPGWHPGAPTQPGTQTQPPPGWQQQQPGWQQQPPGWQQLPPGWPMQAFPFPYPVRARPHGLALAGLGRRLVARLIDIVLVLVLNVVVNGFLAYQWWLEVKPIFDAAMADPLGPQQTASARSGWIMLTMLVVTTALWFAYEVPALANSGQTIGKRLLRVKVVKLEDTTPLGFGRAFRRWGRLGMWTPLWSCYGIGFLAQLVDAGSVLFDQRLHQALHDRTAGTVVVAAEPGATQPAPASGPESTNDSPGGNR